MQSFVLDLRNRPQKDVMAMLEEISKCGPEVVVHAYGDEVTAKILYDEKDHEQVVCLEKWMPDHVAPAKAGQDMRDGYKEKALELIRGMVADDVELVKYVKSRKMEEASPILAHIKEDDKQFGDLERMIREHWR